MRQHGHQLGARLKDGGQVGVEEIADGDDPLRGDRLGDRGHHLAADRLDGYAGGAQLGQEVTVARGRVGGREHLANPCTGGQRLAYGLRPFGQEPAVPDPKGRLGQAPGGLHPRGAGRGELAQAASTVLLSPDSAGACARAVSTSVAKVAGSLTASSARTLRSTSTPATFKPWMNRL